VALWSFFAKIGKLGSLSHHTTTAAAATDDDDDDDATVMLYATTADANAVSLTDGRTCHDNTSNLPAD